MLSAGTLCQLQLLSHFLQQPQGLVLDLNLEGPIKFSLYIINFILLITNSFWWTNVYYKYNVNKVVYLNLFVELKV